MSISTLILIWNKSKHSLFEEYINCTYIANKHDYICSYWCGEMFIILRKAKIQSYKIVSILGSNFYCLWNNTCLVPHTYKSVYIELGSQSMLPFVSSVGLRLVGEGGVGCWVGLSKLGNMNKGQKKILVGLII